MKHAAIVGAGICGVTTALTLRRRGWRVTLLDQGPIPHPDAASTDVSKVIRADYGADDFYTALMHEAFVGWDAWNASWPAPPYHETGFLLLSHDALAPGGFEYEGFTRAPKAVRIGGDALSTRFPAWNAARYPDGYYNPRAGWAESGRVVATLTAQARAAGVTVVQDALVSGLVGEERVTGVTVDGAALAADVVIVAAGTWTWTLIPELHDRMVTVAQPVFHFLPADRQAFAADVFPVWAADIARTGWYGFPALPDGRVKVANHGPGIPLDPRAARVVPEGEEARFREFLAVSLPGLAEAPVAHRRLCCYSDTFDGDFFIDAHPTRSGLVVAAGGSGHLFKFGPVIGGLVADAVEGRENRWLTRFRWRERAAARREAARNG